VIQANGAITSDGAVTGATLAGTISTAAQNSITSASSLATVGTITSGTWSGVIDGSATMTLGSDATGDVYYRDSSGFLERLGVGSDGQVLTSTGTLPNWEDAGSGSGDFSGPGSATDNAVVRFNGTGGKTGQNSGLIVDDSNNVTGAANVTLSGELDAATGDFSGDVDVDGTLEADAITIGSTAIGSIYGVIAGSSSIATVGTIGTGVWEGTDVGVAHGGTGLSTVAANTILTGNGASALTAEANLTFDGTLLTLSSTAQITAELNSSNATPYLVIAAEAETQNDTAGIAFNATKGQAIGGANTMAHIYAKVTNSPGNPLYGNLYFNTNNAETDSTKMVIASDGNVTVSTGDLVIGTSGKGISFAATGDGPSMSSELLDDYEEGLASAVAIRYGGHAGTAYDTTGTRFEYTKIGRVVYYNFQFTVTNPSVSNDAAVQVAITGLPFTASNNPDYNRATMSIQFWNKAASTPMPYVLSNTTRLDGLQNFNTGGSYDSMYSDSFYRSSGNNAVIVTGFYHTDS
jgi:hypothetical protein